LAANAGRKSRERIVLLLAFVAQQTHDNNIFKGSLQVAVVAFFPHVMSLLNADILAGNAMRQRLLTAVSHVFHTNCGQTATYFVWLF